MYSLSKWINFYCPLRDFLYILQLEEYELPRYLAQVGPRLLSRNFEQRDTLKFTLRIKITLAVITLLIAAIFTVMFIFSTHIYWYWLFILSIPLTTPYLVYLASFLVEQPIKYQRDKIIKQVSILWPDKYSKTKVIGITGSYGKTTTKYLLKDLLESTFNVEIVPENINTTLGIAKYILDAKVNKQAEFLIVEMGAYVEGDIKECCQMLPPDIAVITKLGDQHLERFGNFVNLVKTKYEIFKYAKTSAKKITTREAYNILAANDLLLTGIEAIHVSSNESSNKQLSIAVARSLNVNENFISEAIANFKPPERRNQVYVIDDITVIDSSYNLSPETAKKMLHEAKQLSDNEGKQLVVMTGGISEQGELADEENRNFGLLLNKYASRILLNPTVYHKAMLQTLNKPYEIVTNSKTVTDDYNHFIDAETEVLLYLTGHTDLAYL